MKSRMMGDYQVRFCERLGVKYPGLLDDDLTFLDYGMELYRNCKQILKKFK